MATEAAAATRTRARARVVPAWIWLTGIVVLSALARYGLARRMVAPWIMVDELYYSELAKSFAATGHFAVRGVPDYGLGLVYPALIAPAYRIASVIDAYTVAKAINTVLMSLAAVPAYLLARRLVGQGLALVVSLLTVAVPSMVYTGTLMTENAFYPLFLLVALTLVVVLERPTFAGQVLLLALCGLAFLTRAQAVALLPAVLTAPLLYERRRLFSYLWLYGLGGAGVASVLGYELWRGRSIQSALGAYQAATDAHYDVATAFRWLVYHVAELDLYVGIAPFAALLVLALMFRTLWGGERAFVAAAGSLTVWLLLEVAIFASSPSVSRIEERNMFYVAPLFFVALAVWIDRGLPRPRAAGAAALVAAALPGAIPFAGLINGNATSDTLAFLPWWSLQDTIITLDQVAAVAVLCAVGIGLLFLLVPPRLALALPAVVLAYYGASLWAIETNDHGGVHRASVGALFGGIARPERDWVDRAVGRDAHVAFVWSGTKDKFTLWQNEFFNRSVGRVYDLGPAAPGGLPSKRVTADPRSGSLRGTKPAPYVLTDDSVRLFGVPIARDARKGMILYRVAGPLQLAYATGGVYPDSWSGRSARYTRYECEGGRLTVLLESDRTLFGRPQVVASGKQSVRVPPGGKATLTVPLRSRDGRCTARFTVTPTAVPAAVIPGSTDTRRLGIHFSRFRFSPEGEKR